MKKIIQRIFLGILCAVVVVVSAAIAKNYKPTVSDASRPTITDIYGNAYIEVLGEAGEIYAAVTDANGKVWAAEYIDGVVGNTVASLENIVSPNEIPYVYNGPYINETVLSDDYTGKANEVQTTEASATKPSQNNAPSNQSEPSTEPAENKAKAFLIKKYQKMFADGNYYVELRMDDDKLGDAPIMAAAKNGNIYISTSVDGLSARIIYLADKDTSYVIIDKLRFYSKLTNEILGNDTDMNDLNIATALFESVPDANRIDTSDVEIGGKILCCESFIRASDGATMKYYFDGETLVRIDSLLTNGETQSTYVSKITSQVDDSLFKIPSGYLYMDLSKFV